MSSIITIWNQTDTWFRDHEQAARIGSVIIERLADDRIQTECRYLIRLKWHLHMGYQEVSYSELEQNLSDSKMALLNDLFRELAATNYKGIDAWADRCETEFPIVEDKWFYRNQE